MRSSNVGVPKTDYFFFWGGGGGGGGGRVLADIWKQGVQIEVS